MRFTMEEDINSTLFEEVHYYLFDKNVTNPAEIKQAMKKGGAIREFYLSDLVTHIISDTPLELNSLNVSECYVLHSDWVTMSTKCEAQLPLAPFDLRGSKLFSGLTFCTAKLSHSDMEKLVVMVTYYGGKMQKKLDSNITHLVTMEMKGAKYDCAVKHSDTVKIITPDWLVDSITIGKTLDEQDYHPSKLTRKESNHVTKERLPTPNTEIKVDHTSMGKPMSPLVVMTTEVQVHPENVQIASDGKKDDEVELQPVDETSAHDTQTSQDASVEGMSFTQSLPVAKVQLQSTIKHVSPVRNESSNSNIVQETDKTVTHSAAVRPEHPISNTKIISSTNDPKATSEAQAGESVIAIPSQDECDPSSVLLQGVVVCFSDYQECMDEGTVDKWKQVIVQHGGQVLESYMYDKERCTHLLALHKKSQTYAHAFGDGKCVASAHWLNDVLTEQKMFAPKNPLHFPTAFKWQLPAAEKCSMTLSNYTDSERELVKDMVRICGIPCTGHLDKETTHLVCKRPEGKKYEKALEWGVEVINSTFLAEIIHNGQVPAVLFPRYTKLGSPDEFSPGSCFEAISLLKPWERFMARYAQLHPGLIDQESHLHTLSQSTPSQSTPTGSQVNPGKHERAEDVSFEYSETKKPKLSSGPKSSRRQRRPVVLVTGISQSVARTLKESILKLGGLITEKGSNCTHIVLPRVTRTVKFLSGISVCDYIVAPDWVEKSSLAGVFLDEAEFEVRDKDAEELFGMNISTSLNRAQTKKLLQGVCFYSTPSVQPPHSSLKEIIQSAGGELLLMPELRTRFGRKLERVNPGQLLVISTPEDVSHGYCSDFVKSGICVYNAELVLTGILRQQLDYALNRLLPQ